MTVSKRPLDPNRIRKPPAQGFSWIDRRFVRDGWIDRLPQEALLLYFFLVAVSDREGLSFYADSTVSRLLDSGEEELSRARAWLLRAGLILYRHPLYQVLPLSPGGPALRPRPRVHREGHAGGELMSLGEILRHAWRQAAPERTAPDAERPTIT